MPWMASDHPSWLAHGRILNITSHLPPLHLAADWIFMCILTISRGFGRHQVSCSGGKVAAAFPTIRDTSMTLGTVVFRDTFFRKSVLITDMVSRQPEKKLLQWPAREIQWLGKICGNLWHLWPLKDCNLGRFVTWGGGFCEGLGGLFLEGGAVPMCGSLGSQRFDNEFNWFYRRERLRKDIW